MDIEHAAGRRAHRHHRLDLGLERVDLRGGQPRELLDPVDEALLIDRLDPRHVGLVGRDQQLAAAIVGDAVRVEERVQHAPPGDAQPRLERAGRVVEPGVDDLGVARRHALADRPCLLEHRDRQAALDQGVATREPHGTGADHDRVELERGAHGPATYPMWPGLGLC